MATAPKKTASGGKSGGSKTAASRSAGTGSGSRSSASRSRSGAARGGKSGKNAKRPIRREVTGLIYLLLALCVLVSYFTADGWLMVCSPSC